MAWIDTCVPTRVHTHTHICANVLRAAQRPFKVKGKNGKMGVFSEHAVTR